MALMVTFNGQFKPYRIPEKNTDGSVHRIREMAPSFNDLIHHYIEKEPHNRQNTSHQEYPQKSKISHYIKNQQSAKRKVYARDIMSTKIHSLTPKNTVAEGMEFLSKYKVHHIPIIENNTIVGIVSDRLLLNVLILKKPVSTSINEVMVKEVVIGQEHSSISDIARVMVEQDINCIPIISKDLELRGLVTNSDILELLVHSFPLEIYA